MDKNQLLNPAIIFRLADDKKFSLGQMVRTLELLGVNTHPDSKRKHIPTKDCETSLVLSARTDPDDFPGPGNFQSVFLDFS